MILVLLAMTWSLGESTPERFEMARGIVLVCRAKRRRAGKTAAGYQKALCRLPMRPLVALAAALRARLIFLLGNDLFHGGFIPLGCDGSRLECCRNDELLAYMGKAGKVSKAGKDKASKEKASRDRAIVAKLGKAKASKAKASEAKVSKAKASETKASKAKAGEAKASKAKASEAKTSKAKASEAKTSKTKACNAMTSKAKVSKAKTTRASRAKARAEARIAQGDNAFCSPAMWVTAVVHLTTGVPWSWMLGRGNGSERVHLRKLLPTLPKRALVVADAGFDGYDLATAILKSPASFLIRMSSKSRLIVDDPTDPERFVQGPVKYWPDRAQKAELPPLELRLIRVRSRRKKGQKATDVWLLTNVDASRMSIRQAAEFYRMRWENEGLFRSYKRTLAKVHLVGRTVRSVHREAYGSLLACQLLLAQGVWASRQVRHQTATVTPCSVRKVLLAVRAELQAVMKPNRRVSYRKRLEQSTRERRQRKSKKLKRQWPQRTPHKPPKPPVLLTMNDEQKALFHRLNAVT